LSDDVPWCSSQLTCHAYAQQMKWHSIAHGKGHGVIFGLHFCFCSVD